MRWVAALAAFFVAGRVIDKLYQPDPTTPVSLADGAVFGGQCLAAYLAYKAVS